MSNSFKFAPLGVPLAVHWPSIFIMLILFSFQGGVMAGASLFAILFASIMVHEYSHVWMAQRLGINVRRVFFMMFGAVAELEGSNIYSAKEEFKVAIAGPLASLVLALVGYILFKLIPSQVTLDILIINLVIGTFNLLPLYPMDGGRVLNSFLASRLGIDRALKVSVINTTVLGSIGVVGCLYLGYVWPVIIFGLVIWMAWRQKMSVEMNLGSGGSSIL